jgi:histidine triad (HIT) family protein
VKQSALSGEKVTECVFCKIVREEAESYIVYQDEHSVAFLDKRPLFPGHCLLVPRDHYETLTDLPLRLIEPFFTNVRLIAKAVEKSLEAEGSFIAINNKVSQSIPHLHVHIVPRRRGDGLKGFFWPRIQYKDENHIRETQEILKKAIAAHAQNV